MTTPAPTPPAGLDLRGRHALVTGSTRGIGAALAEGLARAGASVAIHGRRPESARATARRLAAALPPTPGQTIADVAFDVTDHEAMAEAVTALQERFGPIDVLVNNAGIQRRGPLVELPLGDWEQVLSTNLTSCFVLGQAVARGMIARGAGKIINVCSVQTMLVRPSTAPYAVAKAGLANLTKAMCAEWAPSGIQANGLAPGYIDTELNASLIADPEFDAWVRRRTPAGRWGTPADLVGPAVWLASSASDFVNGQTIYVDGGITAVV